MSSIERTAGEEMFFGEAVKVDFGSSEDRVHEAAEDLRAYLNGSLVDFPSSGNFLVDYSYLYLALLEACDYNEEKVAEVIFDCVDGDHGELATVTPLPLEKQEVANEQA